ncbi:DMT family transporter [Mesorhizobium sp.]|uniref:DMT family transporter n=1 Tax=Mesorhizobium sp. TaxID=1871066 RepID=UPI0011FAE7F9|nr:DMT family transporter [Mesorhizobium sp.]TIW44001.1 MAG: DMT family transporter [Mesorhizobium sp.]
MQAGTRVLGIFSTGAAFGIQTIAQRLKSASHAAVIVSAESVFGAVGTAIFLGERLSPTGAVGAAVVFGSITKKIASGESGDPLRSAEEQAGTRRAPNPARSCANLRPWLASACRRRAEENVAVDRLERRCVPLGAQRTLHF